MSFIRSETMHRKIIRIPKHLSVQILHELGKMDNVLEFIDVNKNNNYSLSNFSKMIMRCIEINKRIESFYKMCGEFSIIPKRFHDFDDYKIYYNFFHNKMGIVNKQPFDFIENEIINDETNIKEMYGNYLEIKDHLEILKEKKEVWSKLNKLMIEKNQNVLGPPGLNSNLG